MISRKFSTSGFELNISVPETIEEYNSLAPKRENPVLDDAILNTVYRGVLAEFRSSFVDALEKHTGIERQNRGTEEEPKWEQEGEYLKRVVLVVAKQRGLDEAAKSTKDAILEEWSPLAQSIMDGIKFDPSVKERSGGGGNLVGKRDLAFADEAIKTGKAEKLATLLSKKLNRTVTSDRMSIATALKDKRKAEADAAEAAQKAELEELG